VFAARYMSQKIKKKQREALGIIEDSGEELFEVSDVADDSMPLIDDILFTTNKNRSWSATSDKYFPRRGINSDDEPILRGYNDDDDDDDIAPQSTQDKLKECWFRAVSSVGWAELRTRDKIMLLFLWPIGLLRSLTIPCAGPEGLWSRPLAVISPMTVPILLLFSLKGTGGWGWNQVLTLISPF
jgi:hypothetical protein